MTTGYNDFLMLNELKHSTGPSEWSGPDFLSEKDDFMEYVFDAVTKMSDESQRLDFADWVKSDDICKDISSSLPEYTKPEGLDAQIANIIAGNECVSSNSSESNASNAHGKSMMSQMEQEMITACDLKLHNGQLVRFNGKTFDSISESDFVSLARLCIPDTVNKVSSFMQFSNVMKFMKTNPEIELPWNEEIRQRVTTLIPFENYMFDIASGKLHPYSSSLPIFYQLNCKYVEDDHMPVFDRFLKDTFRDDEDAKNLLFEIIGYLLMNGRPSKNFFIFWGAPDSGKSAIATWLKSLLGDEYISNRALGDLGDKFALAGIGTKRLNFCMDLPASTISNKSVSVIKLLTGEDIIDTEKKGIDRESTYHDCKFLFGSNHDIKLQVDDDAFWKRLVLLPFRFTVAPEDRDPDLVDKLRKESSQIVSEAARRCVNLFQRNYEFTKSRYTDEAIRSWRGQTEDGQVHRFIEACCEITGFDEDFLTTEELYQSYKKYCGRIDEPPLCQKNKLSNIIRELPNTYKGKHCVGGSSNAIHGTHGIRWK